MKIFEDFQAKNGSCLNAESGNYRRYMNMILKKWLTFGVEVASWKPTRPPPSHSFTPNGKSLKNPEILNLETIMFGRFHVVIWEGVLALTIA